MLSNIAKMVDSQDLSNLKRVGCVIVLYYPDLTLLSQNINIWVKQVDELILVDNTPEELDYALSNECVEVIPLRTNAGIAYAQNIGVKKLLEKKCEFIVFSDQDTTPTDDTVAQLRNAAIDLKQIGIKLGAIGTRAKNLFTGKLYDYRAKVIGQIKSSNNDLAITEVYSVISSISMIPKEAFIKNGGFDESLFIDGVDHEWCWRAWHKHAMRTFILEDVVVNHKMGEGDRKFLGHNVGIASAVRVFYQYRNYIWLCARPETPKYWKKLHLKKYIVKLIYFPIFVPPRIKYLENIFKGILAGMKGKHSHPKFPSFTP